MRLLGNFLRTSLYLVTAGTSTELLMRLAEVTALSKHYCAIFPWAGFLPYGVRRCTLHHCSTSALRKTCHCLTRTYTKDHGVACNNRPNPLDPSLCIDRYCVALRAVHVAVQSTCLRYITWETVILDETWSSVVGSMQQAQRQISEEDVNMFGLHFVHVKD
jgi:hypothetical protein